MHVAEVEFIGAGLNARADLVVYHGIFVDRYFKIYAVTVLYYVVPFEDRVVQRVGRLVILGVNVRRLHTVGCDHAEHPALVLNVGQIGKYLRLLRLRRHFNDRRVGCRHVSRLIGTARERKRGKRHNGREYKTQYLFHVFPPSKNSEYEFFIL